MLGNNDLASPHLPSGVVTILMTDIEGSTKLWDQYRKQMTLAMQRHNQLLRAIVVEYGGTLVKERGEGDSIFAVFTHPGSAVLCAVDIQRRMIAASWPKETPIKVRLAIHTGEMEPEDWDYYGAAPNRCARLRAVVHGHQAVISRPTYDLVAGALDTEVSFRPLGLHRLRDLLAPEEVYQILHADLPADFPPLDSIDAQPNNLPSQLTSFIGRQRELDDLHNRLNNTRTLSLVGEGGCGKTRLALQLAAMAMPAFADGVWFVDLSALIDDDEVAREVATVLKVREELGRPLLQQLQERIGHGAHLLILDNCERLLDGAAHLADGLLVACPKLKVIATSRKRLLSRGEMLYKVPSLALVAVGQATPGNLIRTDGTRLFVERATFSNSHFALTEDNAPEIAEICGRLEGNALAIELAAARVDDYPLRTIRERLFALLDHGPRTAPERHQSVELAIDWSYQLLTADEQRLLNRLAAFSGGWTEEAGIAIAGGGGIARESVPDLMANLLRSSLLTQDGTPDGPNRYRMHETVRQFARQRLGASGEEYEVLRCHAGYFLDLAERAEPELKGADQLAWLQRLDREADNNRAALRCMRENRLVEPGLRLAGALWRYWYLRGQLAEGREQLERALALAGADSSTAAQATALHGLGILAALQGDFDTADRSLNRALTTWQATGDVAHEKNTLNGLGMVASLNGQYTRSAEFYAQSIALNRQVGDTWALAATLCNHATDALTVGNLDDARASVDEGLELAQQQGDRSLEARLLTVRGAIDHDRGDLRGAEEWFTASYELQREISDRSGQAQSQRYLGLLAIDAGRLSDAEECLQRSLSLLQEGSRSQQFAPLYLHFGNLRVAQGNLDDARIWFDRSRAVMTQATGRARSDLDEGEGWLAFRLGDVATAAGLFRSALQMRTGIGNPLWVAQLIECFAVLGLARNDGPSALTWLGTAAGVRSRRGTPPPPVRQVLVDTTRQAAQRLVPADAAERNYQAGLSADVDETAAAIIALFS